MQATFEFGRKEYSVSEINGAIRDTLQRGFTGIWVTGEITEAKLAPSGHWYFSLKDSTAKLRCVCFRSAACTPSPTSEWAASITATAGAVRPTVRPRLLNRGFRSPLDQI